MAAELSRDIPEDEAASLDALKDDLEVIIKEMQAQMGRFPTQEEVVMFVFSSGKEREDILNKGLPNGS